MNLGSVLDASAFLAYLQDEPGAEYVATALEHGCAISAANWAEMLSKLAEVGKNPYKITATLTEQGLMNTALYVLPFDEEAACEVARLKPLTKKAGLSLGDRACLALGLFLQLPVITTDQAWKNLGLNIKIEIIR